MTKRLALMGFLVAGVVVFSAGPSDAWRHGGVFIGVGPYPYWWYPPPYYAYPPPYYPYPPPVVVEEPPVYVEREPAPPPAAPPEPPAYWYYCSSAKAYYPNVPACPEAWMKVPARPQP
jgi:hypothetical protein